MVAVVEEGKRAMSDDQTTNIDDQNARTARLIAKSEALGRWYEAVGEMLYDASDRADGVLPDWSELPDLIRSGECDSSLRQVHIEAAGALRRLDPPVALRLAGMLTELAGARYAEIETDLWRKVERAAGYEAGSLTGKPGVKRRVFL